MKLGFLTACLPERSLGSLVGWAAQHGYEALEVASWPTASDRPHTATHVDAASMTADGAERIRNLFEQHRLALSSIAYYENNLHPDPELRKQVNDHLKRCIDAAATLDCPTVGTFVGRHPGLSVQENLAAAEEVFKPLIDHAEQRGVRIVIENCPMPGWHPDGYPANLAYSPELWEWMFSLGLYLNYDPSHLGWLGIDPVKAARAYVDRIAHVQAKDVEVFPERRDKYGVYGKTRDRDDPWDTGWWRYRVPGRGQIDWNRLIDVLYETGYDGVVSVEHEDPVWSGTDELIEEGLTVAFRTLREFLVR
jgi:sugar phosphate isomerase/epimerase